MTDNSENTPMPPRRETSRAESRPLREARLAEAMRDNLRRRKAQKRARAEAPPDIEQKRQGLVADRIDAISRAIGGAAGMAEGVVMSDKVRLRAEDVEDLAVIAAFLQDAGTTIADMVFDPNERQFMAVFCRYRREAVPDFDKIDELTQISSALVFGCIDEVKHRGLDRLAADQRLCLLTIATEPGEKYLFHIDLVFDDGLEVQLRSQCIDCRLEDFGEVEACADAPTRHFEDAGGADRSD